MDLTNLIYLISASVLILYLYSKWKFSFWKDRNVYYLEPTFLFGNLGESMRKITPTVAIVSKLYNEVKARGEKYGGFYAFWSPQLVPVDLELIRCIVHKDFAHFTNHGFYVNEERDPLSGHLFNLEDDKWRNLRSKLTPTFTSGKMKMMFQTMVDCTNGLQEMLKESATINDPINIKDVLSRFTTDVIGSVAFGLEINSMKNPDSDFLKYGKAIFHATLWRRIIFFVLTVFPRWLTKSVGVKVFSRDVESFYINLVKDTVRYRETNNIYRKDFMHLLIQLKNIGRVTDDADGLSAQQSINNAQGLTINEMAAQAFVFFIAGFETSATTMTFALLELSQNNDVQDKVREEINRVLQKHDNKITYEAIMEMEYLEKVVSETLRKHPPVSLLPRVCNKDYKIENSDLVIKSGLRITIPVISIHMDPEYYPNPDKFDPERFSEENKAKRPAFTFMPFGEGPRTCIGLRFGKLQTKVGLCSVLKNYKLTLNEKTESPIKYDFGFILAVRNGVWLNLESIQ